MLVTFTRPWLSTFVVSTLIALSVVKLDFTSQASHFDRDDVALPGFKKYFKEASDEEREHADKLMKYQNLRGGQIILEDVKVMSAFAVINNYVFFDGQFLIMKMLANIM